jgi:23S rRNA (pseudouridine1915-N3)-methyltransferase
VRVTILCVGGAKGSLGAAIHEYERRAARYWRLRAVEVNGGIGRSAKADPSEVMRAEAVRIMAHLPDDGEIVAVTRSGRALGSRDLADFMEERALRSVREVTFVIGGAFGFSEEILKRATTKLALSALTLPHEVARLLLAEQLYRAGTISRNEPYHKGP